MTSRNVVEEKGYLLTGDGMTLRNVVEVHVT